MGVHFTDEAQDLIRRVRRTHPDLYLLLDDTGCCGPSNVFLQDRPPAPIYDALDRVDGVEVYIHPAFAGARSPALTVDAYASEADDSFSLETAHGQRLTLGFRKEAASPERSSPKSD